MFDMLKNSGDNDGYQIRITYSKKRDRYFVTGHILESEDRGKFVMDGSSLQFNTIEDAIKHITDYPESLKRLAGL